jgi:hypothetical protein
MGQIKSALELALERTQNIQGDKSSLEAKELKEEGMKLFQQILEQPDLDPMKKIDQFPKEKRSLVLKGLFQVTLNRIKLPNNELSLQDLPVLERAMASLVAKPKVASEIRNHLEELFSQYLGDRDQLVEAVIQQYTPVLRQKEQQIAQQTGQRVQLTPEQDPEFQKFLKKNLDRLDQQYQQGVDTLREQLTQMFEKAHK